MSTQLVTSPDGLNHSQEFTKIDRVFPAVSAFLRGDSQEG